MAAAVTPRMVPYEKPATVQSVCSKAGETILTPVPKHPVLAERIHDAHHVPRYERRPNKPTSLLLHCIAGVGDDLCVGPDLAQRDVGRIAGNNSQLGNAPFNRSVVARKGDGIGGASRCKHNEIVVAAGQTKRVSITTTLA